ncbi:MAG: DUF4012 domain-containing protein [Actinomycetota bacterium]
MPKPGDPSSPNPTPPPQDRSQSTWQPESPEQWKTSEPDPADWHPDREEAWRDLMDRPVPPRAEPTQPDGHHHGQRRRRRRRGLFGLSRSRRRRRSHRPSTAALASRSAASPAGTGTVSVSSRVRPPSSSVTAPTTPSTRGLRDRPPGDQARPGEPTHRGVRRRRRRSTKRKPKRRGLRIVVYSILGALVVLIGISLIPGYLAGQALEQGRDAIDQGEKALLNQQNAAKAAEAFAVAESAFDDATRWAENPFIRLEGLIPYVGRTPDAVARLSRAGRRIATAGSALSQGVLAIDGGLPGLAPRGGRVPVESFAILGPAVARARAELEQSGTEIAPIKTSLVIPPVSEATTLVRSELSEALRVIRAADAVLEGLPKLAGVGGTRRYFIAAQNPAELRGTGGIIGLHSIMTVKNGVIDIGPFDDKLPPNAPPQSLPFPSGSESIYRGFGGPWTWLNTNVAPDAPEAAEMIETLWLVEHKNPLDGVIFVTPQALASLMNALGDIEIPRLDYTVTSENLVKFTTNESFFLFEKKQFLRNRAYGLVADQVLNRFFAQSRPTAAVKAIVDAASAGHIIVHAVDDDLQQGFRDARIDGRFRVPRGDFLSVIANNIAGNKVDYYVKRSVDYEVTLGAGGTSSSHATVTFENTAPATKGFTEALGPYPVRKDHPAGLQLKSGEAHQFVTVYCPARCDGTLSDSNDPEETLGPSPDEGVKVFATEARIKSKDRRTFELDLRTDGAWEGDNVGGTYRLRLYGQPTIQPTQVRLALHLPQGMRFASSNVPLTIEDGALIWEGTLGRVQDIAIAFELPLFDKLWTQGKDLFNRPVFRFG